MRRELVAEVGHEVAERAQQPRRGRHDDREGAHQLGHRVGVQRSGAAEGHERELARVVSALDGDHAQRAGHVLVDDREDALGRLARPTGPSRRRPGAPPRARGLGVEHHLAADQARRKVADDDVGVGHRRRLAAARRRPAGPGLRAGRLGADAQRAGELRARGRSSRRPRRRCARRPTGTLMRNWPIVVSRPIVGSPALAQRDVGRGAAHVEGEDVRDSPRGRRRAARPRPRRSGPESTP